MNTTVKVILYTSKTLSNGEHPVMLRIIKDRKPKYISTGISCIPELWDEKLCVPKKKHRHYKEAKLLIAKKKLDAEKIVYDLENESKNLSAQEIKGKLKKERVNNPYLYKYFDKVIDRFKTSGQIKTSEIYKDTKRNLVYYTGSKEVHFSEIDVSFLNQFEEYLKAQGKGGNTIYLYLRTLRAVLNKAIKEVLVLFSLRFGNNISANSATDSPKTLSGTVMPYCGMIRKPKIRVKRMPPQVDMA